MIRGLISGWLRSRRRSCCPGWRFQRPPAEGEGVLGFAQLRECTRLLFFVAAAIIIARPGLASGLLVWSPSASDTALSGATVAEPKTPTQAMFSNPAALAIFGETAADFSTAYALGMSRVNASTPPDYDERNSFPVLAPAIGLAVPVERSERTFHFGFALYGSVGNNFAFDADPEAGVQNRFFSETGIFTGGAGMAYSISERLSVGAAISPLYGM